MYWILYLPFIWFLSIQFTFWRHLAVSELCASWPVGYPGPSVHITLTLFATIWPNLSSPNNILISSLKILVKWISKLMSTHFRQLDAIHVQEVANRHSTLETTVYLYLLLVISWLSGLGSIPTSILALLYTRWWLVLLPWFWPPMLSFSSWWLSSKLLALIQCQALQCGVWDTSYSQSRWSSGWSAWYKSPGVQCCQLGAGASVFWYYFHCPSVLCSCINSCA